jgi:prepilin-type N-terminal cleavage/methylation domain-containing protein
MRKGFTLIELMIVIAILAILGTVVVTSLRGCGRGSKEDAMASAQQYVGEMGWEYVAGTCAGNDSDGDGYISCDLRVRESKGAEYVVEKHLECASGSVTSTTSGCKARLTGAVPVGQ